MIGSFTLTLKAKDDLKSIAVNTQKKWGKEQRRIYVKQFDDTFHMLAKNPDVGVACSYIKIGYRKFPNSSHIIFYRVTATERVEIIRILHKRMDARPKLGSA